MKRSRCVSLVLLGTAPLLLAGCSPDDSSRDGVYTSVASCVAAIHDPAACQQGYAQANQHSEWDAPHFDSIDACEANYGAGKCDSSNEQGHAVFWPLMTGFLLSQAMHGGAAPGPVSSVPAFRNRSNQWFRRSADCNSASSDASSCSSHTGAFSGGAGSAAGRRASAAPLQAIEMPADRAVTVSRGGFGEAGGHGGSGE